MSATYQRSLLSAIAIISLSACTTAKEEIAPKEIVAPPEIDPHFLLPLPGFSNASCGLNGAAGIEAEIITEINTFRSQNQVCGDQAFSATTPVRWNLQLLKAAQGHSLQMAQTNVISHFGIDSRAPMNRVRDVGYVPIIAGENIAAGLNSVKEAMKAWEKSPGHCVNLMNPLYQEVAVACVKKQDSFFRYYWTMSLAAPYIPPAPVKEEEKKSPRNTRGL